MDSQTNITVAVVMGGNSPEREVSLRSGIEIEQALQTAGYRTISIDYRSPKDILGIEASIFFPVLHGKDGEDGKFARACDEYGYRHIGSGQAASELCFNKARYLALLNTHGYVTARGKAVTKADFYASNIIKQPFVLKPTDGGSSIDTFIVRDVENLPMKAIHAAFENHTSMLLEPLISGTELTAGVLDTSALPIVEIIPPTDEEFDYQNKYNGKTQELCPPQHISTQAQMQAQLLAEKIHALTNCRHYSRTDMILQADGSLVVLETNTLPGMTAQSLYPKAAAAAGMTFPALVDTMVKLALND